MLDFFTLLMQLGWRVVTEIALIFYESSVFILLGFALAGLLHEFISTEVVARRLGQPGVKSILWSAILGAPLPLCSCGVLPTAAALRRKGASKPAIASFIVSVPETGVDSVAVTYGLMGPIMAVIRPIVALVTAIVAGIACLFITRDEKDDLNEDQLRELESHDHAHDHDHDHGSDGHKKHAAKSKRQLAGQRGRVPRWRARLGRISDYGFRTVLDEVAFWIVAGLVVTGVLMAFLPDNFFEQFLGMNSGILPMIVMAFIGVPLYTCASMSTPIAAGLIASGLSPGAALVYLLAGPATSIASLTIVGKLLGRRSMIAYVSSIIIVAICAGLLLDEYVGQEISSATVRTFEVPDGPFEQVIKLLSTFIFLALFVNSVGRKSYREPIRDIRQQGSLLKAGVSHIRRLAYSIAAAILIALIIPLVTVRVGPGEEGMIVRFGAVVEQNLQPGIHFHYPWPVDEVRLTSVAEVRETRLSSNTRQYLTSDENVIALTSVIQYRVSDAYAFEFLADQSTDLLGEVASRILVQEILSRPIDQIYTTQRSEIEHSYRNRLEQEIAELGYGFELVEARLEDVHAPNSVHTAFRDVASALEDRKRATYKAEGEAISAVTDARGLYEEQVTVAKGDANARTTVATGRAAAFVPYADQVRNFPEVSRFRLRHEAIDRGLTGPRKYLNTVPAAGPVDLWIDPSKDDVLKFNYKE